MENENEMMEAMVNELGGNTQETTATETEQTTTQETQTEQTTDQTTEQQTTEQQETTTQNEADNSEATTRANQAFIHMRQQNKQQQDMLKAVAGVLGIDNLNLNDPNQLMTALQSRVTKDQAQKQNVPVEVMERLNRLEADNAAFTEQERKRNALLSMQQVANNYALDAKGVEQFAGELIANNINPLEANVNLDKEYLYMHKDAIIQAAVDKALAEERARASKAAEQSTTPDNTTSKQNEHTTEGKIDSVRALEAFMVKQMQSI